MKKLLSLLVLALLSLSVMAADKTTTITSPDGKISVAVNYGLSLTYSITMDGKTVLAPSPMAMTLANGTVWGENCKVKKTSVRKVNTTIDSPFTRQATMPDVFTELTLQFRGYNLEVRAYNDGVAYRFVSTTKGKYEVKNETVAYNFPTDQTVINPYIRDYKKGKTYQQQYYNSFENTYTTQPISQMDQQRLSFLPLIVNVGEGKRMCITEVNLESYPGLYLAAREGNQLCGVNAPYPKTVRQGGHNMLQGEVQEVEDYIAKAEGPRSFPWRVAMLSRNDKELAANNLSYLLATPSRVTDISWIRPGKVAWDWWNDWNIKDVDFRAGVNTETYKYYIDFASKNHIEYVILDEGWAVNKKADLLQIIPEINLQEIIDYGKQRNVGIILWAGYYAFNRDMENVVKHFAEMGVKGFKIDFMDRDDQQMTEFYYRAAQTCAKYHMLADFHGAFKPSGLVRTYPNVINFEGVAGLENMKWASADVDQMEYDCQLPFIRQAAGPMDYTQGAMINAARGNYRAVNSEPMSQGTRCHQLALYITLESPLNMLCDSPTNYLANPECTEAIAAIPTVWDETHVLCGEIGKYVVTARRKGNTWYVGGTTNWDARDITFTLPEGIAAGKQAVLFRDGINADRKGEDYKRETVTTQSTMTVHLAPGGGFLMKI